MLCEYDVVQFNDKHKWAGALGIVIETKLTEEDIRYTVGVPIPEKGQAYIYVMESDNAIEFIGTANLVMKDFVHVQEQER